MALKNMVLRKLFGTKEEDNNQYGLLHKGELGGLGQHRQLNTVKTVKSKRLRRGGHEARMDETRTGWSTDCRS
jgi:hypothetical protein